jgi:hypothetical protein
MKKPELSWDWMLDAGDNFILVNPWLRILFGLLGGLVMLFVIGMPLDLATSLPDVVWLCLSQIPTFSYLFFGGQLPKLHWAYGLSRDQKDALSWYRDLSKEEQKQLPTGWDKVVRECGDEVIHEDRSRYLDTVASKMTRAGQEVISSYRKANEKPKVLDYRIETQLQLMAEKAADLTEQARTEKEIEAKIRRMK